MLYFCAAKSRYTRVAAEPPPPLYRSRGEKKVRMREEANADFMGEWVSTGA